MFAGQVLKTVSLKSVKSIAGLAAILSMTAGLTACDGNDAAIIGGTIAVIAGASGAFDDDNIGHDDRDHRDRRDRRDHRGDRDDRRDGRGRGGRGDHRFAGSFELSAAGLSGEEMNRLATYRMPSAAAIEQLGAKLELSRSATEAFVGKLMEETKAQMADINSPAWVACQSAGQWKTNANGGTCKSTEWSGCSPETGASFCAAL